MFLKSRNVLFTALASASILFSGSLSAQDKGLISIIVNDMSNPYWQTEGTIAERTAEELGYEANVSSHVGDTNTESNQVDTAITNGAKAIILTWLTPMVQLVLFDGQLMQVFQYLLLMLRSINKDWPKLSSFPIMRKAPR